MQRFRRYIGKDFLLDKVKSSEARTLTGFMCDSLPESVGDFVELEFTSDWHGKHIILCLAVLMGQVKRIMFVVRKSDDADDVRPLTEEELRSLLDEKGNQLMQFLESITQ